MKRVVSGMLCFLSGSAALCLYITLQSLSSDAPLALNNYWTPFVFGGTAGAVVGRWLSHRQKAEKALQDDYAKLKRQIGMLAKQLVSSIKELELSIKESELSIKELELSARSIEDEVGGSKRTLKDKGLILVIDDDDQIRKMHRELLEDSGFEVIEASDGKEGLEVQGKRPADLVITDLIMPEMDGKELIIKLQRDFPGVKIIAMTGGGDFGPEMDLDIAARVGADRVFAKPVPKKELLKAVRRLL